MADKRDDSVRKAAMALNYCAVSISSIIDYNDRIILDQEYNAILNNINMQEIVKDDALRLLFNRILDTCNYFKIQDGDRAWVLRDYENNMKNAVFNCMPQFNLILAGGNPWTMLIGAVHQVGVCYMNYRRNVNQYREGKDKALWELQKGATEELHSLRKELFNASWNLSKTYNIPDEWRLTQPQIDRYLQVLKDDNGRRTLERLDYMKDEFMAYPPFWYQVGALALMQAKALDSSGDQSCRQILIKRAATAYETFDTVWHPIMRNDMYAAMSSIDQIAMLNPARDRAKISELLARLCRNAKYDYDIIQLATIHYLSIQDTSMAEALLRALVNEGRNISLNGRLLSRIYVELKRDADYEDLRIQIGAGNVVEKHKSLASLAGNDLALVALSLLPVACEYCGRGYASLIIDKVLDRIKEYHERDNMELEELTTHFTTGAIVEELESGRVQAHNKMKELLDILQPTGGDSAIAHAEKQEEVTITPFIKTVVTVEEYGAAVLGKQSSTFGAVAEGAISGVLFGLAGIAYTCWREHQRHSARVSTAEMFDDAVSKMCEAFDLMLSELIKIGHGLAQQVFENQIQIAADAGDHQDLKEMIEYFREIANENMASDA